MAGNIGLVNNAAIGLDGILATMHEKDIHRLIRLNTEAPIILTKYACRTMLLARGRILNVGSIIGDTGFTQWPKRLWCYQVCNLWLF